MKKRPVSFCDVLVCGGIVATPPAPLLPSCPKTYDQTLQQMNFYAIGHWWNLVWNLVAHKQHRHSRSFVLCVQNKQSMLPDSPLLYCISSSPLPRLMTLPPRAFWCADKTWVTQSYSNQLSAPPLNVLPGAWSCFPAVMLLREHQKAQNSLWWILVQKNVSAGKKWSCNKIKIKLFCILLRFLKSFVKV